MKGMALLILLFLCGNAFCQQRGALERLPEEPPLQQFDPSRPEEWESPRVAEQPPYHAPEAHLGRKWTTVEVVLSGGIMLFALGVIALETLLVVRSKHPWSPQEILRVFGLTLILTMSVLLVTAGYSKEQAAPVMALLGVIAGYLLGTVERSTAPT